MIFRTLTRSAVVATAVASTWPSLSAAAPVYHDAWASLRMQACGEGCGTDQRFSFNENQRTSQGDGRRPTVAADYFPTPNGIGQSGYAQADLAAMDIHATATGSAGDDFSHLFVFLQAGLSDRFLVSRAGFGESRLSVDLSGVLSTLGAPTNYYASVTLQLLQAGSIDAAANGRWSEVVALSSLSRAWGGSDWGSPNSLQLPGELSLVFDTPDSPFEWSLTFGATYTLRPEQGVVMDLGHTLTVHFDAPPGAVVTSDSGFLPTATGWQGNQTVPVPSTWLLVAAGLFLVGRSSRVRCARVHR